MRQRFLAWALVTALAPAALFAAETPAGLSLTEVAGARPAALGEAMVAVADDVSASHYNPASLRTLEGSQALFSYQDGVTDDAFGRVMVGIPKRRATLGVSVGYYDGGDVAVFSNGQLRNVNAQTDIVAAVSGAMGTSKFSFGATGKYLSSKLIEQESANAFALDVGLAGALNNRLRWGTALQNVGTDLTYIRYGSPLPRLIRAGLAAQLNTGKLPSTLFVDITRGLVDGKTVPAVGIEATVGPLALRLGFRAAEENEFAAGMGFQLNRVSIDYSTLIVSQLEARQRISLGVRFGGRPGPLVQRSGPPAPEEMEARAPEPTSTPKATKKPVAPPAVKPVTRRPTLAVPKPPKAPVRRVYAVRMGDTLGKISRRFYGTAGQWKRIQRMNRHIIGDGNDLTVGTVLIIPDRMEKVR